MYTDENYLWGMVVYYLGVAILLTCAWRFSAFIRWQHPRRLLLLLIAIALVIPIQAYTELDFLAPAFFVAMFEGLTGADGGFLRGLVPIMVAQLVALVGYCVFYGYRGYRQSKAPKHPSESATEPSHTDKQGTPHGST